MPHMPHRTMQTQPKPAVAEETPIQRVIGAGIERHQGTTRVPRPRVLKPPIG
jgi:hypothetical protein